MKSMTPKLYRKASTSAILSKEVPAQLPATPATRSKKRSRKSDGDYGIGCSMDMPKASKPKAMCKTSPTTEKKTKTAKSSRKLQTLALKRRRKGADSADNVREKNVQLCATPMIRSKKRKRGLGGEDEMKNSKDPDESLKPKTSKSHDQEENLMCLNCQVQFKSCRTR